MNRWIKGIVVFSLILLLSGCMDAEEGHEFQITVTYPNGDVETLTAWRYVSEDTETPYIRTYDSKGKLLAEIQGKDILINVKQVEKEKTLKAETE